MSIADNGKVVEQRAAVAIAPLPVKQDTSDYQWVEVPEEDLFGEEHTGVSINFDKFGPGKHFVSPEKADEIQRLLNLRLRSDMRILQPNQDKKMFEIMERGGKKAPRGI